MKPLQVITPIATAATATTIRRVISGTRTDNITTGRIVCAICVTDVSIDECADYEFVGR